MLFSAKYLSPVNTQRRNNVKNNVVTTLCVYQNSNAHFATLLWLQILSMNLDISHLHNPIFA